MALLNYTTEIDAWRTVSEIQQLLARFGACNSNIKTDAGKPAAISFAVVFNGVPFNYLLPCNTSKVLSILKNDPAAQKVMKAKPAIKKIPIEDHAQNVGWRIIKDWIEAQVALIEVEMVTLEEVFLPYLILNAQGETLASRMLTGEGFKQLTNGNER